MWEYTLLILVDFDILIILGNVRIFAGKIPGNFLVEVDKCWSLFFNVGEMFKDVHDAVILFFSIFLYVFLIIF